MMPDCPLCLESHTLPLQDQLCRLRFEIINLRLELRELLAGERQLTEMLKQRQSPKNWRLSTETDPVNSTGSVETAIDPVH